MTEREKILDNYLLRIASNLDISETMRKKAETSYRAVGQWLGDFDDDSEWKLIRFHCIKLKRPCSKLFNY